LTKQNKTLNSHPLKSQARQASLSYARPSLESRRHASLVSSLSLAVAAPLLSL